MADARESIALGLDELSNLAQEAANEVRVLPLRLHNVQIPAVNLPSEILGSIFENACVADIRSYANIPDYYLHVSDVRRAIISTCSHWRQVVLKTSSLWGTIYMTSDPESIFQPLAPLPAFIALEIERSGGSPLSLQSHTRTLDGERIASRFLEANLSRCEAVHFEHHLYSASPKHAAGVFGSAPLPHLRFLYLSLTRPGLLGDNTEEGPFTLDLTQASSLRDLYIELGVPEVIVRPPGICNVARLHMNGSVRLSSAISLINACTGLETLSWRNVNGADEFKVPPFHPAVSLLNLHLTGVLSYFLLGSMQASNVQRLCVEGDGSTPDDFDPFKFPHLRSLTIQGRLRVDLIVRLLQAHPDLEHIALKHRFLDAELVRCLGEPGPTSVVFPRLHHVGMNFGTVNIQAKELLRLRALHMPDSPPLCLYATNHLRRSYAEELRYPDLAEMQELYPGQVRFWGEYRPDDPWDWHQRFGLD